jgi:hypothetical protein
MPRVLIQAGHSAAYPPYRPGGGGAPQEAEWATNLAARIADRLTARGIEVVLVGAWLIYINGVKTLVTPPPAVLADYDLAFCIHYDALAPGHTTGCFIARAAGDPMGAVSDKFIAIWKAAYPAATGIPLKQQYVTVDMTDYYAFRTTSAATPGVIAEHGIGQGDDKAVLFNQIDRVADIDAKCICQFVGVAWDAPVAPAPVDPCADVKQQVADLSSALNLANWQKHEFEAYIVDADHRASVDEDAASKDITPRDDMLQWASDHHNAGETAP